MKKRLTLFVLALIFLSQDAFSSKSGKKAPNIIFISICSLQTDFLPVIGSDLKVNAPNLENFFKESVLFREGHTDRPWSNAFRFFKWEKWNKENPNGLYFLKGNGVLPGDQNVFFTPPDGDTIRTHFRISELSVDYFIEKLKVNKRRPFFAAYHTKHVHYPYLLDETMKNEATLRTIFTDKERERIERYVVSPEKYAEKFPFFRVLFGSPGVVAAIQKKYPGNLILETDEEKIAKWRASEGFLEDVEILKKAYRYRIHLFDRDFQKLMKFIEHEFGGNSIVVVGSDHGEMVGDFPYLTHGEFPYEPVNRVFMATRFPGQKKSYSLETQISQESMGKLVDSLVQGLNRPIDFLQEAEKVSEEDKYVFAQNCSGSVVTVRKRSKWKLHFDVITGKSKLFNLELDPTESSDVSLKNLEMLNELRAAAQRQLLRFRIDANRKNCHFRFQYDN